MAWLMLEANSLGLTEEQVGRNAALMALQAERRRGKRFPEYRVPIHFDNSRLVKAPDPARVRQMRVFSAAVTVFFSLAMIYGVQHVSAITASYRVERLKQAELSGPDRINRLARAQGMGTPEPGQILHSGEPDGAVVAQSVNADAAR